MNQSAWDLLSSSFWPIVQGALVGTIPLALASFAIGMVLAIIVALMRLSRVKVVSGIARVYISVVRGTPLLVQLFVIFYGLPSIGLVFDPWPSAVVAFSINVGGYAAEVVRAAILSVPKGQWEAARSTGLTFLGTLGYIVLPQAIRLTIPPITNRTVAITKNTALGTVIGVPEILNQATSAQSFSGNATPLMLGAIAYVILFIPVVALGRFLETRFAWRRS